MRLAIAYASATALAGMMAIRLAIFRYCLLLFFYFASFLSALIVLNFGISYLYVTLTKRSSPSTQSRPTTLQIPPLNFTRPEAWHQMLTDLQRKDTSFRKPLHGAFVIDDTVNTILEFILRDFVVKWYSQISPKDDLFPISVEKAIRYSLTDLVDRLKSLDLVTIVVRKLTPHLTTHMHDFRVAEIALRGLGLERSLTESAELDAMFATRYHNGHLHPAVTGTKVEEIAWLRKLVDRILPIVMPKEESSSNTVRILVREIVSNMVLFPIMDMLSDPDFWNQQIDARAGTALRERKMVKQLRQVLEKQHSDISGSSLSTTTVVTIRSMLYNTKTSKYEAFILSISKCNNLLDLKRVRSEIATQMRKIRAEVAGHNKADIVNGQKVEHLMTYLNRLASARKKADKKIALLGGADAVSRQSLMLDGSPQELRKNPPLKDVLANPANLSYFMEFMDRRHRLVWVQFWLIVDGFKNPLEDVSDSEDEGPTGFVVEPSKGDMATFVQDAKHIYDSYFASKAIPVKDELAAAIERYLETDTGDIPLYIKARRSILKAQKEVFARMKNEDYPLYLKSDLYYKSLTSMATTASPTPVVRTSSPLVPPRPSTESDRPALNTMHRDRGFLKRSETSDSISSIPLSMKHAVGRSRSSQSISTLADVKSPLFPDDTPEKERHSRRESVPDLFGTTKETPSHRSARDIRPDLFDINEDSGALFEDSTDGVDEVEAALSSIVQDRDKTPASTIRRPRSLTSLDSDSIISSEDTRKNLHRRRIFDDDDDGDFSGSEEPTSGRHSDSEAIPDSNGSNPTNVQIAPPGDLELAAKISRMTEDIDKLEAQESILKQLESKHDLTGKTEELRIVRKSLRAVERELSNARFQKSQYEAQENENRLKPGKTQVSIDSCTIGTENGKEYALYIVQVQQLADDGSFASGWVVARRYSEFHILQQRLCARYPSVRHLEFPAKRMVLKLQKNFVEQRRLALDKYLRDLIEDPIACSSRELGAFLSQQNIHMPDYNALAAQQVSDPKSASGNFMSHIYTTVANGIDDLLSTQGMIEAVTHRLGQQVASIAYDPKQTTGGGASSIEAPPMLDSIPDLKAAGNEMLTAFTEPMCDLFIEVFELQGNNNWLRRGAIVIIMQQILGGTIERKFREAAKGLMAEDAIMNYLLTFRNTLWPDGNFRGPGIPRTAAQKVATKNEANRKLSTLLPDLASNVIGRSNSRKGARKLFAAFQNRKLNQHLLYMIVDDVVKEVFPEMQDMK